jgi:hypothetical protein
MFTTEGREATMWEFSMPYYFLFHPSKYNFSHFHPPTFFPSLYSSRFHKPQNRFEANIEWLAFTWYTTLTHVSEDLYPAQCHDRYRNIESHNPKERHRLFFLRLASGLRMKRSSARRRGGSFSYGWGEESDALYWIPFTNTHAPYLNGLDQIYCALCRERTGVNRPTEAMISFNVWYSCWPRHMKPCRRAR